MYHYKLKRLSGGGIGDGDGERDGARSEVNNCSYGYSGVVDVYDNDLHI